MKSGCVFRSIKYRVFEMSRQCTTVRREYDRSNIARLASDLLARRCRDAISHARIDGSDDDGHAQITSMMVSDEVTMCRSVHAARVECSTCCSTESENFFLRSLESGRTVLRYSFDYLRFRSLGDQMFLRL